MRRWRNLPLALAANVVVWLANRAIGAGDAHDSGLYHYAVIAWTKAHPIVPGLANLDPIFAYNNASMLCFAMLDHGVLTAGLALFALHGGVQIIRRRGDWASIFAFVLVTPLMMIALGKEISSLLIFDSGVKAIWAAVSSSIAPQARSPQRLQPCHPQPSDRPFKTIADEVATST